MSRVHVVRCVEPCIANEAPEEGFEPPTRRLTAGCSTPELLGINGSHALECETQNVASAVGEVNGSDELRRGVMSERVIRVER